MFIDGYSSIRPHDFPFFLPRGRKSFELPCITIPFINIFSFQDPHLWPSILSSWGSTLCGVTFSAEAWLISWITSNNKGDWRIQSPQGERQNIFNWKISKIAKISFDLTITNFQSKLQKWHIKTSKDCTYRVWLYKFEIECRRK